MAGAAESSDFNARFGRFAGRVRRRLWLRYVLSGACLGAAAGVPLALVLWWLRQPEFRLHAFGLATFAGALAGALLSARGRMDDVAVALFLDARLKTSEAIVTAVELGDSSSGWSRRVAADALSDEREKAARPTLFRRWHVALPLCAALAGWVATMPLRPLPPVAAKPSGAESVKLENLAGLEQIEALERLHGLSPEQERRMKRLAEQARELREALRRGLEKREALSRIAKLRDAIAAEKLTLGDQENRAGLDAAVAELEKRALTEKAAKELSEGDLTAFDAEMQRLATLAEQQDREAAREALKDAARRAREKGARALADALERQQRALEKSEAKAEALRELARRLGGAMDESGREAAREFERSPSPEAQRKLAEAMERALKRLTEEERKKLAENLKKNLDRGGPGGASPLTREQLEDMAKRLEQKGADKLLEEQLRELAKRDPSEDAERERGLGEADRGGAEAQRGLGVIPTPGGGQSGQGRPGGLSQEQQGSPQAQGRGNKSGGGPGEHAGETKRLEAEELRSKANVRMLPGAPMHAASQGRAPARAGESANQLGTGVLGDVGPGEVSAVEGTEVPEEYREQVGRYFEP
jgi:hypothetical protein